MKEKILVMTNPDNAKALYSDENRFPPIVNLVFGNVWHPEDPSNKHWFNKSFPRTRVILKVSYTYMQDIIGICGSAI